MQLRAEMRTRIQAAVAEVAAERPNPAGVTNAIRAGLAGGGFEQTDLTDEGAGGATGATNTPANEGTQIAAELASGSRSQRNFRFILIAGNSWPGSRGKRPRRIRT